MAVKESNFVAMSLCFFCHEGNEIMIHKRFGDLSSMDRKVSSMRPCSKCEDLMKQGIMIISVRDGQFDKLEKEREAHELWRDRQLSDGGGYFRQRREHEVPGFIPNPYRTGVVLVMKDEAFLRIFCDGGNAGLINRIIRCRWSFMEDSVLELTGLFDQVDKPDEVPFRVECKKKHLDPREEAIRLSKGGKISDGEKEAEPEVPVEPATGEDHPGGLPGDDGNSEEGER